jgi:hypothetical protein
VQAAHIPVDLGQVSEGANQVFLEVAPAYLGAVGSALRSTYWVKSRAALVARCIQSALELVTTTYLTAPRGEGVGMVLEGEPFTGFLSRLKPQVVVTLPLSPDDPVPVVGGANRLRYCATADVPVGLSGFPITVLGPNVLTKLDRLLSEQLKGSARVPFRGVPAPIQTILTSCTMQITRSILSRTLQAGLSLLLWLEINQLLDSPSSSLTDFEVTASQEWFRRFLDKSAVDYLADRYETRMKWLLADMQARYLDDFGDDLPPRPSFVTADDHSFLGGSSFCQFERIVKRGRPARRRLSVLNGLTGLKKRQPPVPESVLAQALESWTVALFEPRSRVLLPGPLPDNLPTDFFVRYGSEVQTYFARPAGPTTRDWVEILPIVKEIVRALAPSLHRERVSIPTPGTKSRLGSDTGAGGSIGYLKTHLAEGLNPTVARVTPVARFHRRDLTSTVEVGGLLPQETLNLFELLAYVNTDYLEAKGIAIADTFKPRVISQAVTPPYWAVTAIQKLVHGALQSLPEFRLTKETPDHDITMIVNEVIGSVTLGGSGPNAFRAVSGDYKASTDNLNPDLSDLIVALISEEAGLDPAVHELFRACLTGHVLHAEGDSRSSLPQTWGQLMGSPASFPILCIANLAVVLLGLRRGEKILGQPRRRVGRSGVVINGDDVGFVACPGPTAAWKKSSHDFGLPPSPGKNFLSDQFVQVNSKMFMVERIMSEATEDALALAGFVVPREAAVRWVFVPCPSLAVLAPPRHVSFSEFLASAPSWQAQFLFAVDTDELDRLNSLWLRVWKNYLAKIPTSLMNWFLPRSLGGFGLRSSRPILVNEGQCRAAAWFRDHTDMSVSSKQAVRWIPGPKTTSIHADATALERTLSRLGVISKTWLPFGDPGLEFIASESVCALSGWSYQAIASPLPSLTSLVRVYRSRRRSFPDNTDQVPTEADVVEATEKYREAQQDPIHQRWSPEWRSPGIDFAIQYTSRTPPDSEQSKLVKSVDDWFNLTVRTLARAARSTSRVMSLPDILAYRNRVVGWSVSPDFVCEQPSRPPECLSRSLRFTPLPTLKSYLDSRNLSSAPVLDGPFILVTSQTLQLQDSITTPVHPQTEPVSTDPLESVD